jgi:hypothetical protein
MLDTYGYFQTESILNEWNYIKSWDQFLYSMKHILSIKGAAFTAACMCGGQNDSSIDMLMYYDARPSAYNGLFDYYTNEPLKGYYPFKMFDALYKLGAACKCSLDGDGIYAAAAKNGSEEAVMISYFTDDDTCEEPCNILLDFCGGSDRYEIRMLDRDRDMESIGIIAANEKITLAPNTVCLLKSVRS